MPSVTANARSIEFYDRTYAPRAWEVSLIYDAGKFLANLHFVALCSSYPDIQCRGFINTFGNSVGLGRLGWKYYFVFVGWDLVASVCGFYSVWRP